MKDFVKMRTNDERQAVIDKAEAEIQEICSKYCVTIDAVDGTVFLNHHERHKLGDWSVRAMQVYFAPF